MLILAAMLACGLQDTTIVRQSPPAWGQRVVATRELSIGSVDGPPESTFGQLAAMAVGGRGHMFGLDVQANTVREFDASGQYVRSWGRRGSGPGELKRPEALAVVGDRLIVRDLGNARFTIFPLSGGEPQSWRFQSTSGSYLPFTVQTDSSIATPIHVGAVGKFEPGFLRFDTNGVVRDTVTAPTLNYSVPVLTVASNGGQATYTVPLAPQLTWTFLPDGRMAGGVPNCAAFLIVGGSKPVRVERRASAVPVPRAMRADLETGLLNMLRQGDPSFRWRGSPVPGTLPYFEALYVDMDGRVWVKVAAPPQQIAPASGRHSARWLWPAHFEVYDRSLRYLGLVRLPVSFQFGTARGNEVWGIEADDMDVQYLVRYRLNVPGRR